MSYRDTDHLLPRYEQIATDIAKKISRGFYGVGEKIHGRSTLAGEYNVSPETIRRAIALLQSQHVVEAIPAKGILIKSKEAAEQFLEEFSERQILNQLQSKLSQLIEQRQELDREIERQLERLVTYTSRMTSRLQQIEEIRIPQDSPVVGQTLEALQLRSKTGATVVAIERGGQEIFSPSTQLVLDGGDLLIIVGPNSAKELVKQLINKK